MEASILARVLGVRLLTLDATVVLAPAEIAAHPAARPSGRRPLAPGAVSRGLAEAALTIEQGSEVLGRGTAQRPLRGGRRVRPTDLHNPLTA